MNGTLDLILGLKPKQVIQYTVLRIAVLLFHLSSKVILARSWHSTSVGKCQCDAISTIFFCSPTP